MLTIEPGKGYLFSACWSPVCPTVFAAVTESGHLLLYDLGSANLVPTQTVEASPTKQPIYCLQFNAKQSVFIYLSELESILVSQKPRDFCVGVGGSGCVCV